MAESDQGEEDCKLTPLGCVLTLLSLAVVLGTAIPIVRWRDPDTGQPLPRMVAISAPVILGAIFHAVCAGLLRLFGLRTWTTPEAESFSLEDDERS